MGKDGGRMGGEEEFCCGLRIWGRASHMGLIGLGLSKIYRYSLKVCIGTDTRLDLVCMTSLPRLRPDNKRLHDLVSFCKCCPGIISFGDVFSFTNDNWEPAICFRIASPGKALGAQRLRDRAA